jgi:hypothetical protein
VTGRDGDGQPTKQDVLLEVNLHVHEAARRFQGIEPGPDPWDFNCECGAPDCRVTVSLTLAEYEALRGAGQPVLAPGHEKAVFGDTPAPTA